MKLATRLAILSGSALLAMILAAVLFSWQTNRISNLYDQRFEAKTAEASALAIDTDLQTLLATYNRLLFATGDARRGELAGKLDELGDAIEADLRRAVDEEQDRGTRLRYQPALTTWTAFRSSYQSELQRFESTGDAAAAARSLDSQVVLLENQIEQILQENQMAVQRADDAANRALRTSFIIIWTFTGVLVLGLGVLLALTSRNIYRTVTSAAEQNERARRSKEIQANLMTEVQGETDPVAACGIIVSRAAQAMDAKHGALYLQQQSADGRRFALTASYAFHRRKDLPNSFELGDGLVGQCALEGNRIEVTGAPADYVEIVSGLGKTGPLSLILIPIKFESEVLGVLELAGFRPFSDDDIELLESVALGAGVAISAIESAQQTRELLQVSQAQTEELQTQEEELRAANEQLTQREDQLSAQNAELEETTEELRSQQEELRASSERLEGQTASLEIKNEELSRLSASLEAKAEELAVSSRYKSEFLANMSHELRTPLNSILILAGLLTDSEDPLTETQVQFADTIEQSGKDLLNLIDEVLDLAKVESGSMRLEREKIHSSQLVSFLERTFGPIADDKGIDYRVVLHDDAPQELTSDYTRVKQIVKNLVANAVKFTDQGSVTVELSGAGDIEGNPGNRYLAVAVVDTGIGIDEKDHNLIFESFQQADRGSTREYGGTGLGLAISRELARHLGGEIKLVSAPGQGSTFTCYLPVSGIAAAEAVDGETLKRPTAPSRAISPRPQLERVGGSDGSGNGAPAPSVAERLSTLSGTSDGSADDSAPRYDAVDVSDIDWPAGVKPVLLIVEDDKTYAGMLAGLATDAGFDSVVTTSGRTALALAREHQPAAITLDIGLPDMAGWVVLDVLKHDLSTRHIPVNVISGVNDDGRGRRMGAIHTLNKPADLSTLRTMFAATADFLKPGPRHVLVAEDDAKQRQVVAHLIESDDISITCVGTGQQVLDELGGSTPYDCLVLDLGLPDIDGIDLIERIKDQLNERSLPVIVHTGRELTEAETERLEVLAAAIVLKNAKSPERLLDETALFLHRVADDMPDAARRILSNPRRIDESLEGNTVLLVDDDVRNVFSLGSVLKRYGITVLPARNGQEGLDTLNAHPEVDLVLMDIMMPVMDGYEAMRRIRSETRWRTLPVVALTAKAMKGDRQKCLDAGASDYVTKPVDMDQLTSVLRVWLANRPRKPQEISESG
ncbi:two-component system sensor histidine kinase/response regulator [Mycolicibacterium cyprinidarum]|nr:two-component system sensor histidine kinase/response regulator [Mycolicibacterium sp. NGTWS1803]